MSQMLPKRRSREELEAANQKLIERHNEQLSMWLAATLHAEKGSTSSDDDRKGYMDQGKVFD